MFLGHSDKEIVSVQDRNGQGDNSRAETYSVCYVDTGVSSGLGLYFIIPGKILNIYSGPLTFAPCLWSDFDVSWCDFDKADALTIFMTDTAVITSHNNSLSSHNKALQSVIQILWVVKNPIHLCRHPLLFNVSDPRVWVVSVYY